MSNIDRLPEEKLGIGFIPQEFLPPGCDENYLRFSQNRKPDGYWRNLSKNEIKILEKNGNLCDNWSTVQVTEVFEPQRIANNEFYGLVRIGKLEKLVLRHHDLRLRTGITSSRIISCDIGDNAAVHNVRYLSHYIVGDTSILFNIDEMSTTDHARFGNGVLKEGESEDTRYWIDVMNEAGGRKILPYENMIPADAYIWANYREDDELQKRLIEITQRSFDSRRGYYGTIGKNSVVKSCRIIKDVKIGPHSYIKGANKLKNLTINSSKEESTQIGEGVELVNGIIGFGCHVFYGCKAVRFVMCDHSNLKYGARLIHSVLGENSTVSCCELLNNLIFPAHEQHHNNSFLTASILFGQSNIAAGATIGSNHNSRSNDGEIRAGRGFWPGLYSSLKHSSRFASFTLLQKADFPSELNITLPFSLVIDNERDGRLEIIPAFWWLSNMYALERNAWKFAARDNRLRRTQNVEYDALAPDSIEEVFTALELLELWTAESENNPNAGPEKNLESSASAAQGRRILLEDKTELQFPVYGKNLERSTRPVLIRKCRQAYHAYRQMIVYYGVKNCLAYIDSMPEKSLSGLNTGLSGKRKRDWVNIGGQLVPEEKLSELLKNIRSGAFSTWDSIHSAYEKLWNEYPLEKQRHAYSSLLALLGREEIDISVWKELLDAARGEQEYISRAVSASRSKDYENPFRKMTYRNEDEMNAVIGKIEENSFIRDVRERTSLFVQTLSEMSSLPY